MKIALAIIVLVLGFAVVAEACNRPRPGCYNRHYRGYWCGYRNGWVTNQCSGNCSHDNCGQSRLTEVYAKEIEQRMRHLEEDRRDAKAREERYEPKLVWLKIVQIDKDTMQLVDSMQRSWVLVQSDFKNMPKIVHGSHRVRLTELQSGSMYLELNGHKWYHRGARGGVSQ